MRNELLLLPVILLAASCSKPPEKIVVPEKFRVEFETSKGNFIVEAHREWSPHGVDRFHELVRIHYFNNSRFFRVLPGFIAQFGVADQFKVHDVWKKMFIPDDPQAVRNVRGTLAFAKSDPGTRATEIFVNLADNADLDAQSFVPFAQVMQGMEVIDQFYSYGELRPKGKGPDPGRVEEEANEYLVPRFPRMDYVKTAKFLP